MKISRKDLRLLILHEFKLGHSGAKAAINICTSMGEHVIDKRTVELWFARFKKGSFDRDDKPRSGRPSDIDLDLLKQVIEQDPRLTTHQLAERFGCSHTTIANNLHLLGKTHKYGVWIPYELSATQLHQRADTCTHLLSFRRSMDWLTNLVTGDEKWVLYVNHTRKKQWLGKGETGIATPRPDPHPEKVMLCVWWNIRGVVHWELLPSGTTVNKHVYCRQLNDVANKLRGKQDKVYFLHDNARPHVSKIARQKIMELGWTLVPHPPYSPDLAPTDYHLFRSLSHHLSGKKFDNQDELKKSLENFFNNKSPDFYSRGISELPTRWQQVVDSDGAYICD